MKHLFIILSAAFLATACGGSAKGKEGVEQLPLTSAKQKISYLMGAENAKQLLNDPNYPKYKKDQLLDGFKTGLKDEKSFDAGCQQTIQNLIGQQGTNTLNEQYLTPGSLCIGKFLGSMFKSSWIQAKSYQEFDEKYLIYGFQVGLENADTLVKEDEKKTIMETFMTKVNTKIMGEVSKREKIFFDKVRGIKGIQELPNGIYLETIKAGNGGSPTAADDVKAHYVLLNIEGDTLQSSLKNMQVPVFNLGQVIPGWTVGIPFMKKGGKYKLYVPQEMAYGKNSPDPNTIPPFATLVFYVELVDFGPMGSVK